MNDIETFLNSTNLTEADIQAMKPKVGQLHIAIAQYCLGKGTSILQMLQEIQNLDTQPHSEAPTNDCLTWGETKTLGEGQPLPSHRREHLTQCNFCWEIAKKASQVRK